MDQRRTNIRGGRLFGHPIHLMLVHFPTALFTAAFVFDAAGIVLDAPSLFSASFYVVMLGLAGGGLAALFGLIDYMKLADRAEAFSKASWHAGIQFMVLVMFAVIAGMKYQDYPEPVKPGVIQMVIMAVALAAMGGGNYIGGELVIRHGAGIEEEKVRD